MMCHYTNKWNMGVSLSCNFESHRTGSITWRQNIFLLRKYVLTYMQKNEHV